MLDARRLFSTDDKYFFRQIIQYRYTYGNTHNYFLLVFFYYFLNQHVGREKREREREREREKIIQYRYRPAMAIHAEQIRLWQYTQNRYAYYGDTSCPTNGVVKRV